MSDENKAVETASTCTSCGISEIDDIKLVPCDDCDLVKYCSDECQRDHKSQHENECNKRAADLRDELLFKQPESSHWGDCPICMIPLPLDWRFVSYQCCSKRICKGCVRIILMRETDASTCCPFCRTEATTDEEDDNLRMKRIEAKDPNAMVHEGVLQYKKGDYDTAFEYYRKAAELGNIKAHFKLACLYHHGEGIEEDEEKEIHHLEQAAIGGHPDARYNLGFEEWKRGNNERAVKHWVIAATQGHDDSLTMMMEGFKDWGFVQKEDLATALRAHKAAVDATKSPERELEERITSRNLLDRLDDD